MDKWYTTYEAAQYLWAPPGHPKITPNRVHKMIKQRKFADAQLRGGVWFIPKKNLDAENKKRKNNPWLK